MKILHIVEPLATGIFSFLVDLTKYQSVENEVYIAYGIRSQTPKDFKKYFNENIGWINVQNFQDKLGFQDIKAYLEIRKILKDVNPDIVHLHSSKAGALGRWASFGSKRKVFYTPHGFSFLMQDSSKLKRKIYWLIEYISAKTKSKIIGCSEGEYREAKKITSKSLFVNNGIDTEQLSVYLQSKKENLNEAITICTNGRILFQKNPQMFNKIAELLPQYNFIWIGDGELKSDLNASNITISGWVSKSQALDMIAHSDIFLLPSLWEGLSISLLEAMFLKKICLVSNIDGNNDVIKTGFNGFVCDNVSDYVDRIQKIVLDVDLRDRLIENAHKDVLEKYNIKMMAEKYQEIYNN